MNAIAIAALIATSNPVLPLAPTYLCENGRHYAVERSMQGLIVKPAGGHARQLVAQRFHDVVGYSDGGLNLLVRGPQVLIGAPELEMACHPAKD
jgi:hypothetical protein